MKKDIYTNTVEDAEEFDKHFNAIPEDVDKPDPSEFEDSEDEEEEQCNCSDPGCPCGGNKKGIL